MLIGILQNINVLIRSRKLGKLYSVGLSALMFVLFQCIGTKDVYIGKKKTENKWDVCYTEKKTKII